MDILNTIIKDNENKKEVDNLAICPKCNSKMVDNTFMNGSRLAGGMECSCGFKMIF